MSGEYSCNTLAAFASAVQLKIGSRVASCLLPESGTLVVACIILRETSQIFVVLASIVCYCPPEIPNANADNSHSPFRVTGFSVRAGGGRRLPDADGRDQSFWVVVRQRWFRADESG